MKPGAHRGAGELGARQTGGRYRRSVLVAALVSTSLLVTGPTAFAAPGDLDPTFDGDGQLLLDLGDWTLGGGLALQPDGRTVVSTTVCNYKYNPEDPYSDEKDCSPFLTRHMIDGSLDASFGDGGRTTPTPGGIADHAILPDDKILAAGSTGVDRNPLLSRDDFFLTRYEADGTLDTSFGDGGGVVTDLGDDIAAVGLALAPDGKVVVAGNSQVQGTDRASAIALARYRSDGSLDDGFGSAGKVVFDPGVEMRINDLVSLPSGEIVVAGWCVCRPGNHTPALMRFNEDGSLDESFGRDGVASVGLDNRYNQGGVNAVAIQPDGRLVAAGYYDDSTSVHAEATLLRFNTDGSLDKDFGRDGKVMGRVGSADELALQPNGKIVTGVSDELQFYLERYKSNGAPDVGFGEDGGTAPDDPSFIPAREVADVVTRPNGRVLMGGTVGDCSRTCYYDTVMAQFDGGDNSRPTARDDRANTRENRRTVLNVLRNDSDPDGDRLTVARVTRSKHGAVRCNPRGDCIYVPDRGYRGKDAFSYVANDGMGGADTGTVSIAVQRRR